jgi:hypothetical protein
MRQRANRFSNNIASDDVASDVPVRAANITVKIAGEVVDYRDVRFLQQQSAKCDRVRAM